MGNETKTFEISFFKAIAIIAVFGVSVAIPIFGFYQLKDYANNLLIKQNLETIKEWAVINKIKNDNYLGIGNDINIIKKKIDIKVAGGDMEIYVDPRGSRFCAKANLNTVQGPKFWCVDSSGYTWDAASGCYPGSNNITCQ